MSTYMPKADDLSQKKWYILDAEGKSLGRVASTAALILRGKHKPTFTPNADCGDGVIIVNCAKAVLTGKKLEQKHYIWHTGWIGGLKKIQYKELMKTNPDKAMFYAVRGMLPNNTLGDKALTRLRVYAGSEHEQQAQKPEVYNA
jgi:large subunit ribosomal protein L13